jgi:hypothetical protein
MGKMIGYAFELNAQYATRMCSSCSISAIDARLHVCLYSPAFQGRCANHLFCRCNGLLANLNHAYLVSTDSVCARAAC